MFRTPSFYLILIVLISGCKFDNTPQPVLKPELIYHVVQRSFYDSSGDGHGDLKGLQMKLDYLQELGITSLLLLPLYESIYYHNYFPINFETIDPTLGTLEELQELITDMHSRGMKFYMDMEIQYITEDHPWYKDAYGNPESPYSSFILWDDSLNLQPSSIVYDLTEFEGYDGRSTRLTTLNLHDPGLQEYMKNLFLFFIDPKGDKSFTGGVDGFRIDHMMDDLDNKGRLTGLFESFWKPLIRDLKVVRPDLIIMAEQADWTSSGHEYLQLADVDWVFSFGLCFAIRSFEKKQILQAAEHAFGPLTEGKNQIVFIANHDIQRYASAVKDDPGKLRVGAALNLLIGGVPSIYYGQEIGMRGTGGWNKYGITDGNEIPVREAFEWYADTSGPGMALWYRDTGPWWDDSELRPFDGISLEEQYNDNTSLWHYYRQLIGLRAEHISLSDGQFIHVANDDPDVLTFIRKHDKGNALLCVNLSDDTVEINLSKDDTNIIKASDWKIVFGRSQKENTGDPLHITLQSYEVQVFVEEK